MIAVQDLCRRYGAKLAVDGISFRLERGEVVGFLGLNGAGKTTTMRMLTGYLPPSSGSVQVAGFDVLRQSMEVRRRIGYLPEAVPLYREHRVCEMLALQARLHGLPRARRTQRIGEVLELVGLCDRQRSLVGALSKGLRQRVGLAVALLADPEVLILDEPTSGLDPLQRREVRAIISRLGERRTVLFSSHILAEVEAICPRVIILHRGRIAADGTPAALVANLGGGTHVRLEAVVGADPAAAARLLGSIGGVRAVRDRGRLGIHHVFEIECGEDLREDVGALAASRGWALRELSFRRPALEEIFARVALELGDRREPEPEQAPAATGASAGPLPESQLLTLGSGPGARPSPGPSPAVQAAPRAVYNLNPFDQGWARDLGVPKPSSAPPSGTGPSPAAESGREPA